MTTGYYRDATADDIDHIVKLVEFCYRSEESAQAWISEYSLVKGRRSSKAEISRSVTGPNSMMIVGEVKGILASCCRLTVAPRKRVHLGLFCVGQRFRAKVLVQNSWRPQPEHLEHASMQMCCRFRCSRKEVNFAHGTNASDSKRRENTSPFPKREIQRLPSLTTSNLSSTNAPSRERRPRSDYFFGGLIRCGR